MKERKTTTVTFSVINNTLFGGGNVSSSRTMFLKPNESAALDEYLGRATFTEDAVDLWMRKHASAHHRRALKRLWKNGYQINVNRQ